MNNLYIPPNLKVTITMMTPTRAAELLKHLDPDQRRPRDHRVSKLASRIRANKWRLNGATIVLDADGRLVDGQHRLLAIVEANMSVVVILVTGVEDVFGTIDDTLPRSAEDWLRKLVAGSANARQIASAISWCWRYESRTMANPAAPNLDQQKAYLESNMKLIESYRQLREWKIGRLYRPIYALLTFIHFHASLKAPAEAHAFFLAVASGSNESPASHALREWLLTERNRTRKTPIWVTSAIVVKAWNAHRAGLDKLSGNTLRFRANGEGAEAFPVIA